MKITTDNLKVDPNEILYSCPATKDGAVLLKPSEVNKYLGSVIKHKILNIGIILSFNTMINIIEREVINNANWYLVSYNNMYYYVPESCIDISKKVEMIPISDGKSVDIKLMSNTQKSVMKVSKATSKNVSNNPNYLVTCKYTKNNKVILRMKESGKAVRMEPSPNSKINSYTDSQFICIPNKLWLNKEYNNNWISYIRNKDGDEGYIQYSYLEEVTDINVNKIYYAMIYRDNIDCTIVGQGSEYYGLNKGDISYVTYQDWDRGKHVCISTVNDDIVGYEYKASDASPLSDSLDMFNSRYLGEVKLRQDIVAYEMHRQENSNLPIYAINNISVNSLINAYNNNGSVKNIMDYGTKPGIPSGSNEVVHKLKKGTSIITTNYISIGGNSFYIGFLKNKANDKNGAVAFITFLDVGSDIIEYNPNKQESITDNTSLPTNNGVTDIGNNSYNDLTNANKDIDKFTDKLKIDKEITKYEEPVFGQHLGVGNKSYQVPGMDEKAPKIPPEYDGKHILQSIEDYNLSSEKPYDTTHLYKINRFHLPTGNSGLSTKSFIFVTRPDLNLYATMMPAGYKDLWHMNADLKRLPTFKYIARMRGTPDAPGIGTHIMNSLEYYGVGDIMPTPWLTVFSNQANGYSVIDREMDTVEMGETFHGNKILYAEPTFKHKIAGTVSIPFIERRDLTLYYTLRLWIDYIQAVSLGYCTPSMSHIKNGELDYAVSLYFISTDETMENILYWEKLTGLIPLTVPDSFFEWSEGNGAREMKYTINFAYSFRTVMDELHLAEINNLYGNLHGEQVKGMPLVPNEYYDFNKNPNFNNLMGKIAMFYNQIEDNNDSFNEFINNDSVLRRYYYGGWSKNNAGFIDNHTVTDGTNVANANFLPNYNIRLQMHGVPYVKGPYIEHDPKSQCYKLRWV